MKKAVRVTSYPRKGTVMYRQLLRQWMNNCATAAQDIEDERIRHFLNAWYVAFEETYGAIDKGSDLEIRVYNQPALPFEEWDESLNED